MVVFMGKIYTMYIGGEDSIFDRQYQTVIIYYDPQKDSYDKLPPYSCIFFSIAVVNDQLVLVGGIDVQTSEATNKLGVWNEISRQWTHPLPPMPTAHESPALATYNNRWLVVIGGFDSKSLSALSQVEILDTTGSGQWYQAVSLPWTCYDGSTTTIGNMCYILGGKKAFAEPSKIVFSVHLDGLISQALLQAAGISAPATQPPWRRLTDTPEEYSTALSLNGALLAVGGDWSTNIYYYEPNSKSWIQVGELPTVVRCCGCAVLPSGELFVTGGQGKEVHVALVQQ